MIVKMVKQIMNLYEKNLMLPVSCLPDMDVPVWRAYGRYRKQMKRKFYTHLYYQRNKNETNR